MSLSGTTSAEYHVVDQFEPFDTIAPGASHLDKVRRRMWTAVYVLIAYCLGSISSLLLLHRSQASPDELCARYTQRYWSPILDEAEVKYSSHLVDGDLYSDSIYRRRASESVDLAWNASGLNFRSFLVPLDRAADAGIAKGDVIFPEEIGGPGYPAHLNVFHLLHCLNTLRQALYYNYDYYHGQHLGPFLSDDQIAEAHIGHCLDMLRQQLMCDADLGMVTYIWIKDHGPYPKFNVEHMCKNFDDILAWAERNQAPKQKAGYVIPFQMGATIHDDIPSANARPNETFSPSAG